MTPDAAPLDSLQYKVQGWLLLFMTCKAYLVAKTSKFALGRLGYRLLCLVIVGAQTVTSSQSSLPSSRA